jgi:hypothetical protein
VELDAVTGDEKTVIHGRCSVQAGSQHKHG